MITTTSKTRRRLSAPLRADQIVETAIKMVESEGAYYSRITKDELGKRIDVTGAAVQYHFPTMQKLRRAVMRAAVKQGALRCVAQGLVAGDPHAAKAPDEMKERAMRIIFDSGA